MLLQYNRQNSKDRAHNWISFTAFPLRLFFTLLAFTLAIPCVNAGGLGLAAPGGYGLKIYKVESGLYPFVQVYFRTFDQSQQPLVNLNAMNVGLMVKGESYDPAKRQYGVQSIRQRQEATRSVLVLDASLSMKGVPFTAMKRAAARFIDSKRQQDEVAILSIEDTKEGYSLVSEFERDREALGRRLLDLVASGQKTRLYDSIAAAMQMCGLSSQGSIVAGGSQSYIVSCSIVVMSDGEDDGSALTRGELNTRITNLDIPLPIYSLAYSQTGPEHFKNLESLSKNSFGIYYLVGETVANMQRIVEQIQNILQSDYVVTFRSYLDIDGEDHPFKLGVEYPSGSRKFTYQNGRFEAIRPPPEDTVMQLIKELSEKIQKLPEGNKPYFDSVGM